MDLREPRANARHQFILAEAGRLEDCAREFEREGDITSATYVRGVAREILENAGATRRRTEDRRSAGRSLYYVAMEAQARLEMLGEHDAARRLGDALEAVRMGR